MTSLYKFDDWVGKVGSCRGKLNSAPVVCTIDPKNTHKGTPSWGSPCLRHPLCLLVLVVLLFQLVRASEVYGWYGAGNSAGWPNAVDGLKGKLVSGAEMPASVIVRGQNPFKFELENPEGNGSVKKPIYLKIFRIVSSPRARSLSGVNAGNDIEVSQNDLYSNNKDGNDYQIIYRTIGAGEVSLAGGQKSEFSVNTEIADSGYYQYDLTDLNAESGFAPGHIYVAGFLRVKAGGSVLGDTDLTAGLAVRGVGGSVLGQTSGIMGGLVGSDGNLNESVCGKCIWWQILAGEAVAVVGYGWVVRRSNKVGLKLAVAIFPVTALGIYWWLNRNCVDPGVWCRWFWLEDIGVFGLGWVVGSVIRSKSRKV